MYGRVVSVTRPGENKFGYKTEWEMLRLLDGFPIYQYPLCTIVSNTHALKIHINLSINRAKTDKYTFTEPRAQIVLRQGKSAAPTPHRGRLPHTISIQSACITLILGVQPVRVTYNNTEDEEEEYYSSIKDRIKLDEEDNEFGDFQNNNDDSDKDEDGNSGNGTIFV